jgi:HlyD family secretion protein
VIAVNVDVGARVARGQVLARLDDLEQRLALVGVVGQLNAAEIEATRAQRDLEDMIDKQIGERDFDGIDDDLLLDGPIGDAQLALIATVAKVAKQEALLTLTRRLNERRVIRAPMAGVILSRSISPGETVPGSPPGPPLFVIGSDPGELRMTAVVDQRHIGAVRPGSAMITTPISTRALPATVRGVSPDTAAVRSSATYEVALDVVNPDGALAAGMTAVAALPMSSSAEALRVPAGALQETATGARVSLVTQDGTIVPTAVVAGVTNDVWTEVTGEGLDAGHLILAQPGLCPGP